MPSAVDTLSICCFEGERPHKLRRGLVSKRLLSTALQSRRDCHFGERRRQVEAGAEGDRDDRHRGAVLDGSTTSGNERFAKGLASLPPDAYAILLPVAYSRSSLGISRFLFLPYVMNPGGIREGRQKRPSDKQGNKQISEDRLAHPRDTRSIFQRRRDLRYEGKERTRNIELGEDETKNERAGVSEPVHVSVRDYFRLFLIAK